MSDESLGESSEFASVARVGVYGIRKVEVILKKSTSVRDVMVSVASVIGLKLYGFFGLQFTDEGVAEPIWLLPQDKSILAFTCFSAAAAEHINLELKQMYFPESILSIVSDQMAVWLFYMDAIEKLMEGLVQTEEAEDSVRLAALQLQMELGDHQNCDSAEKYAFSTGFVGFMLADACAKGLFGCIDILIDQYRELRGLCRGAACFRFLRMVQKAAPSYGYQLFRVKSFNGALAFDHQSPPTRSSLVLAFGRSGIRIYDQRTNAFKLVFDWKQIQNFYCKNRKFCLQAIRTTNGSVPGFQNHQSNWITSSSLVAHSIWQCCVHQHKFYLAHKPTAADQTNSRSTRFAMLPAAANNPPTSNTTQCEYEKRFEHCLLARKWILTRMERVSLNRIDRVSLPGGGSRADKIDFALRQLDLVCLEHLVELSKIWLVKHKDYEGHSSNDECPSILVHHWLLPVRFNVFIRLNERLNSLRRKMKSLSEVRRWSWSPNHQPAGSTAVQRSPSYRSALSNDDSISAVGTIVSVERTTLV